MESTKKNIALAVCTGCGIGACIDTEKLIQVAGDASSGIECIKHPALCSESGLEELIALIGEKSTDRLAVAACSPRVKTGEFTFDGIYLERINLREQVAWVMEPGDEDTQMCAEDQTRMVLAKLNSIQDTRPYISESISSEILVLGGGVAGLNAALEGAKAGYKVHLVEKGSNLGGYAGRLYKVVPTESISDSLMEPDVMALAEKINSHANVKVYLDTTLESISGEPGNFSVRLNNAEKTTVGVGSVVVATGWKPYDTSRLDHLGYGSPRVKTLEEFEQHVQNEKVPDRVVFLLC